MDDDLPRRDRRPEDGGGEAAANAEDDVGSLQELTGRGCAGVAAGTERQRVVLGEGALTRESRHHGRLDQFGELPELVRRLRPQNALADVNEWSAGRPQGADGLANGVGIGGGAHRRRWSI